MRLVGDPARPQLITIKSGIDHTEALERMASDRLQDLKKVDLSGYVPVEEEGRLCDPALRENFIERVFSYRRYQDLLQKDPTRGAVVQFHTIHKYLLLSHSQPHYQALGRLVGQADRHRPRQLALKYGELFMKALTVKATVRKHVTLIVPLTLIRHYVNLFEVAYIRDQVYLNPHPKELMLRNRV